MMFIADNQLLLLIVFFLGGSAATVLLFRKPAGARAWKIADLTWVLLGGFGAITALIAGIYTADSSRIDRQIDIAFAATTAFDRDAARFRLRFCDPAYDSDIETLCDKVEFLSASTAGNADLPLFLAVTRDVAPLQSLSFWGNAQTDDMADLQGKRAQADQFNPDPFLVFTALDAPTQIAVDTLRRKVPTIAADYLIIARAYDELIAQVRQLKQEWDILQANAHILLFQIVALCLVSFAAPFRLGKSIVELRPRSPNS